MDVNRWIITGQRGSGKTTFCRLIIQYARKGAWDMAGIISPAGFTEGIKTSIDAVNIRTDEEQPLADIQRKTANDLEFGDWYFNRQTLDWGNHVLQTSIPCELLVIDELGPLEFNLSLGWVKAFDVIQTTQYRLAMVVIRPELLDLASKIIQPTHTISLSSTEDVPARIHQYIPWLDRLKGSV